MAWKKIVHNYPKTASESEDACKSVLAIVDSYEKCRSVLSRYERIAVSVSGGKDSDIMVDIIYKVSQELKQDGWNGVIHYIWFNTGIEYRATTDHLAFLEQKYGIEIERITPAITVPASCVRHGQPFHSKFCSDMMEELQRKGFQWEDEPLEELEKKYHGCREALRWWCNDYIDLPTRKSNYNIRFQGKYLKEFLIQNPPIFPISDKCCQYAKKDVAKQYYIDNGIQLKCVGVRKAEGGIRATAYKDCYTIDENGVSSYRPLFWYTQDDEIDYDNICGITHSECYTKYKFKRTGCAGCPFNKDWEKCLDDVEPYEPTFVKAAKHIFKSSYEYTKKYEEFVAQKRAAEKGVNKND